MRCVPSLPLPPSPPPPRTAPPFPLLLPRYFQHSRVAVRVKPLFLRDSWFRLTRQFTLFGQLWPTDEFCPSLEALPQKEDKAVESRRPRDVKSLQKAHRHVHVRQALARLLPVFPRFSARKRLQNRCALTNGCVLTQEATVGVFCMHNKRPRYTTHPVLSRGPSLTDIEADFAAQKAAQDAPHKPGPSDRR